MLMLTLGVLLFAGVHFIPSLAPAFRSRWRARLGGNGYRGVFSLFLLGSFALIIGGWRTAQPALLYAPPAALHSVALALLAAAFLLLVVSNRKSRLRRLVRHPQLTAVIVWSVAHLLLNGDSRSAVLFGGLGLWAIGEILAINRREGVWIKGPAPSWGYETVTVLVAAAVVAAVVFAHPWLSGVPVRW